MNEDAVIRTQFSTKRIIEALLFASKEPLTLQRMHAVISSFMDISLREVAEEVESLQQDFIREERAFQVEAVADGYVLRSHQALSPYIQQLYTSKKTEKLSAAALETLAIVAYKQPITKIQIELMRGVDCSGVLQMLQARNFIEVSGKLDVPGRPSLYVTSQEFLAYFGLHTLADLPQVSAPYSEESSDSSSSSIKDNSLRS